jgi:CHAD domain-containing protein
MSCSVASSALALPSEAEPHLLSKMLKQLGTPRDTEAVSQTLRRAAGMTTNGEGSAEDGVLDGERAAVEALLRALDDARVRGYAHAVACLSTSRVKRVLTALRKFQDEPVVLPFGGRLEDDAAARALAIAAGQLFSHPGWEVGLLTEGDKPPGKVGPSLWERSLGVAASRVDVLHSLRKAIREMRYAMEAFQPLYDTLDAEATRRYRAQLDTMIEVQTLIGTMHDVQVAMQVLADVAAPEGDGSGAAAALGARLEHHKKQKKVEGGDAMGAMFPVLSAALRGEFDDAWAAFQKSRDRMLSKAGQQQFYMAILGAP